MLDALDALDLSLGDAVRAVEGATHQLGMPASIQGSFRGTAQAFEESLANEPLLIAAALIAVYVVLGVLYESYVHPITILSTLPSAGIGAILALRLFGMDLSVIALIGILLLIGIVKKNAIATSDVATWLSWPSRFWAVGPSISQTLFDGGLRRARTDEARAVYETTVATYRQTVLGAFQEVEDTLAAVRILADEAATQVEAVRSSQEALTIITNQYRAGTVSYLEVVVAQTTALANARTAVDILGRRVAATVVLVKALGGGWSAGDLPSARDVTRREEPAPRPREHSRSRPVD